MRSLIAAPASRSSSQFTTSSTLATRLPRIVAVALRDPDSVARLLNKLGAPDSRVPFSEFRGDVAGMLEQGFKVAICDQVEEPGKGTIVRREVTRVVTPGTVFDEQMLDPREASFLGAVALGEAGGGLALLDATTESASGTRSASVRVVART